MRIFILMPTYNEKENIGPMIEAIKGVAASLSHSLSLVVIDDQSPDGTAEVIKHFMTKEKWIHLLSGPKQGLGNAYIRGMKYAVNQKADVVFEMDADFSHSPHDIPRMLLEIEKGYSFVIGSRYVPGGSIPSEWGLWRKLNSRFGNLCARFIAGIYSVRDCTAGFRAIDGSLLKKIALDNIENQGYGFQVTILFEALLQGALVKEIPVDFKDRTFGQSKLALKDIIGFIINAWNIRLQGAQTFFKFMLVGFTGVIINLGAFVSLLDWGTNPFLASLIAIFLAINWNFFFNHAWTFASHLPGSSIRGLRFSMIAVLALSLSFSAFTILRWSFSELSPLWCQTLGILPAFLVNYSCNSYWTFVRPRTRGSQDIASINQQHWSEF